ncbi:unnamed protein product [Taenia asiatica]|uniref:Zinc finger C3HC4 RING-type domain-containing protein n=1 Tax=Taenia asiatica TaxID=60517 RepID=A0A0R3VVL8_TAEAS|nr:unnamed protein product [Taenia asiatica]
MRDPHILPCGHTFCLRPCLLPHEESVGARCVYCGMVFHVADLQPNFTVLVQICLRAWYREESCVQNQVEDEQQNKKLRRSEKHRKRNGKDTITGCHNPHDSMQEEPRLKSTAATQEVASANSTVVECAQTNASDLIKLEPLKKKSAVRSAQNQFEEVTQVRLDREMRRALVTFSNPKALQMALTAHRLRLKGANLRVSLPAYYDLSRHQRGPIIEPTPRARSREQRFETRRVSQLVLESFCCDTFRAL